MIYYFCSASCNHEVRERLRVFSNVGLLLHMFVKYLPPALVAPQNKTYHSNLLNWYIKSHRLFVYVFFTVKQV